MYIYKITNILTGTVYIGKTKQSPVKRWNSHRKESKNPKYVLHRAMKKHGFENFIFEVIDGANSHDELSYLEVHYIHKFNSLVPNGYNLALGSSKHITTKQQMSKTRKSRPDISDMMSKISQKAVEVTKKPVIVTNTHTGEVTIFESLRSLSKLGVNYRVIGDMLNGKRDYKVRHGYYFKYKENDGR